VAAPPIAILRATPLSNFFTESPEDRAIRNRNTLLQRATDTARKEDPFINTNK
jgi:hypothetical protein